MPGYTHLQRAQPITLGNYFQAYAHMFQRDLARLNDCKNRMNYSPLGAGALAGSNLGLDREFVANKNILKRETAFGTVEIRNRLLTQYHKMILDCIMVHNIRSVVYKGTIAIYFSRP